MPSDDGLRLDEDEALGPAPPDPGQQDPEIMSAIVDRKGVNATCSTRTAFVGDTPLTADSP